MQQNYSIKFHYPFLLFLRCRNMVIETNRLILRPFLETDGPGGRVPGIHLLREQSRRHAPVRKHRVVCHFEKRVGLSAVQLIRYRPLNIHGCRRAVFFVYSLLKTDMPDKNFVRLSGESGVPTGAPLFTVLFANTPCPPVPPRTHRWDGRSGR